MINKYAKGGKSTANQEQLVKLFQAAAENAQVDPQELVQKASEIGQDEQAAAQFMQGLQLCAQGDPEGIKFIKSLFQSPAFRQGGKIWDFICKHARGGYVAGCGCKKAQNGTELNQENNKGYSVNRYSKNGKTIATDEYANGMSRHTLNLQSRGPWTWVHDNPAYVLGPEGFAIEPESQRSYGSIIDTKYVPQQYWDWLNTQMDMAREYGTLDYKENGGVVESARPGTVLGRLYNRYIGRRAPNVPGVNNRRIRTWVDRNGVQHVVEDANVNGNSTTTSININGTDTTATQKITTGDGRYRINNLEAGTPEWRSVLGRNVGSTSNRSNIGPRPTIGLFPGTTTSGQFDNYLKQGGKI